MQGVTAAKGLVGVRSEAVLLVILVVTAAVHLTTFEIGLDWGGDFAAYIHQAMALAEGSIGGLRDMAMFRVANSTPDAMVGPALYPWGFPALLSPLYAVFGFEVLPFRLMLLGFLLAAQAMAYVLLKGRLADTWVLFIVFMLGLSPAALDIKNDVLSDIPFFFLAVAAVVMIERLEGPRRRVPGAAFEYFVLGGLIVAAYLVRTHGVALVCTLLVAQAMGRWPAGAGLRLGGLVGALRELRAAAVIPYGVFAVGFGANMASGWGGEVSYLANLGQPFDSVGAWLAMLAYNVAYYGWLPSGFLGIGLAGKVLNLAVFLPLALVGVVRQFAVDRVLIVFTMFYMAILIVWPFQLGVRSVMPVMAMYLYFAIGGALTLGEIVARRTRQAAGPGLAAMLIVPLALAHAVQAGEHWAAARAPEQAVVEGPYTANSQALFAHIRDETAETAVFTFWRPRVLMLYTGRRAVLNLAAPAILDGRSDFLLVYAGDYWDQDTNVPLRDVVEQYPGRFDLAYHNDDFLLYRIVPDDTG